MSVPGFPYVFPGFLCFWLSFACSCSFILFSLYRCVVASLEIAIALESAIACSSFSIPLFSFNQVGVLGNLLLRLLFIPLSLFIRCGSWATSLFFNRLYFFLSCLTSLLFPIVLLYLLFDFPVSLVYLFC